MKTSPIPGLSVFSLLGLIFVTLKLTHVINWSWWLIALPFYGPGSFVLVLVLLYIFVVGVILGLSAICDLFAKK